MKWYAASLSFCVCLAFSAAASMAMAGNDTYNKSLIRGRSNMGFTNGGTAEYKYQQFKNGAAECGEHGDAAACKNVYTGQKYPEIVGKNKKSGNFNLEKDQYKNVREFYQYIEVKGDVDSAVADDVKGVTLGDVKTGHNMRVINSTVKVDGKVKANRAGDDVTIGAVKVEKGAKVDEIHNNVEVTGGIKTKGDVNVGTVNLRGSADQVNTNAVVNGGINTSGQEVNVGNVRIDGGTVSGVHTQTTISGDVRAQ